MALHLSARMHAFMHGLFRSSEDVQTAGLYNDVSRLQASLEVDTDSGLNSLAAIIGPQHKWEEVWQSRRVQVTGELFYRPDGMVARVSASEFASVETHDLVSVDILDPNFTGGLSPIEYLARLREGDRG